MKSVRRRPLERRLIKFRNNHYFLSVFTKPKTFSEETKQVIQYVIKFLKETQITFIETQGFDYKIDLDKQIIYGPRPLSEEELLIFMFHVVYLMIENVDTVTATWVAFELLRSYRSPDPMEFGRKRMRIRTKFK